MPKSKVRKKSDFTVSAVSRTPVKVKAGPSSVWFVVLFCGLMLIGLVWLMVFQLAATGADAPSALHWMSALGPCFHDQRVVAHHAVAVGPTALETGTRSAGSVAKPATGAGADHTRVIHPHCG
jgi:hypothetical protein